MGPRARSKFGAPMFEAEVFRKQIYSIEESTCDIVGTFLLRSDPVSPEVIRRPHSDSAPGELCPLPPSLRPCTLANNLPVSYKNALSLTVFFRS